MTDDANENVIPLEKRRSAKQAAKELVPAFSEDEIAEEFAVRHAQTLRFNCTSQQWLVWNGDRWCRDQTRLAFDWTRQLVREITDSEDATTRRRLGTSRFAEGVERFARTDSRLISTFEDWDRDPDVLGTPGGIVDLRTGERVDADPEFFISRTTTVGPNIGADCMRFHQFLSEVTGGDKTLKDFLQRWLGYCLSGHTREQKLCFFYGPGSTGKSTLVNTITAILGDYATSADISTFTNNFFDGHPEQLARLDGVRMVASTETEAGHRWREQRLKQLTGEDMVTARYMRQNSFNYRPQFKLNFVGNHAPSIQNLDTAMQRRVVMIPFNCKIAEPDQRLAEILREEAGGILRWLINGAAEWYSKGLILPKAVTEATSRYFDEQDLFRQWLEESCVVDHNRRIFEKTTELFASWTAFAKTHGEEAGTRRTFNETLRFRGFEPKQIKDIQTKGCLGIRLKSNWQSS